MELRKHESPMKCNLCPYLADVLGKKPIGVFALCPRPPSLVHSSVVGYHVPSHFLSQLSPQNRRKCRLSWRWGQIPRERFNRGPPHFTVLWRMDCLINIPDLSSTVVSARLQKCNKVLKKCGEWVQPAMVWRTITSSEIQNVSRESSMRIDPHCKVKCFNIVTASDQRLENSTIIMYLGGTFCRSTKQYLQER